MFGLLGIHIVYFKKLFYSESYQIRRVVPDIKSIYYRWQEENKRWKWKPSWHGITLGKNVLSQSQVNVRIRKSWKLHNDMWKFTVHMILLYSN